MLDNPNSVQQMKEWLAENRHGNGVPWKTGSKGTIGDSAAGACKGTLPKTAACEVVC